MKKYFIDRRRKSRCKIATICYMKNTKMNGAANILFIHCLHIILQNTHCMKKPILEAVGGKSRKQKR